MTQMPTYAELLNQLNAREQQEVVPTAWFEYSVSDPRGTVIQGYHFTQGTVIGTGTVTKSSNLALTKFRPAEKIEARRQGAAGKVVKATLTKPDEHVIGKGHVSARLTQGEIMAKPIEAPTDE